MTIKIKTKKELEQVTHSVRVSQAVLQYGVGAMVDFPDQTLVTAAPEFWGAVSRIYDDRFAKALDVDYFCMPKDIAYSRFPEWYFCPKCRLFQPLNKWVDSYRKKVKERQLERDEFMIYSIQCSKCWQDLVVARIVTVCENGHLNDFPWIKWVHARAKRQICFEPELKFKTGASGSEGLEGLVVECACGARTTLKDAFDTDIFERMDQEENSFGFRCEGNHPYKHVKEKCGKYPKTIQRGASSVYFPVTYSSLVIPPYADKLNAKIEQSQGYDECMIMISDEESVEDRIKLINNRISRWAEKIANEIGVLKADVESILKRKWLDYSTEKLDVNGVDYRFDEYMALTGEISTPMDALGDFSREVMPVEEYGLPHIKSIALIDKVRVVNALIGFSRINPVASIEAEGFVSVKNYETRWYPAYEVKGEGIFIEFKQEEIDGWIEEHQEVIKRAAKVNTNYANSFIGKNHSREISPKFIMLHTLSHLLISQLSFECGYSIASLCERIYCSEARDGKEMAGIFIYTASGDSEGTLGGLVRQGRVDAFPRIFRKAINSAKTCSNDPVCIMSHGQGRDSINLAACHACALLPETCCEEKNGFLDRGMIVGTFEHRNIGFWSL